MDEHRRRVDLLNCPEQVAFVLSDLEAVQVEPESVLQRGSPLLASTDAEMLHMEIIHESGPFICASV
jgi:hypothetical protein